MTLRTVANRGAVKRAKKWQARLNAIAAAQITTGHFDGSPEVIALADAIERDDVDLSNLRRFLGSLSVV